MQLHTVKGYIQSIYIAEYAQGVMLLDGCCRADVGTVLRFVRDELKRPVTDLRLVMVTHMHPDHAGGAHRLRQLTGCVVATGYTERSWYQGVDGWLMHLSDIFLGLWMANRMGRPLKNIWYERTLRPDLVVADGDNLPQFPEWSVVATPGHTNGDISLWHQPSHRIYVADLIIKVRDDYRTPWPIFYPNRYRDSVAKVEQMQPAAVLLAHGGEIATEPHHRCFAVETPKVPKTHWRAIKLKFQNSLSRSEHAEHK
ncbi:MBL fold metallo-hydrolase [Ferrimonas lipolytica]|uniref:MBL fold metallo-hydrolase n=2 Tax=Ferrimonas lipolytica TaxID=2724191 RepID=A0A6H1UJD7_9GAMM|nr:MBL fold metallo-hydrolase [Ferrimonas lipolytica]